MTLQKQTVSPAITRCKSFGHEWIDAAPWNMRAPRPGYGRLFFRCSRCHTEKYYNLWLLTGEGRPSYRYQTEYTEVRYNNRREWKLAFYRQLQMNNNGSN